MVGADDSESVAPPATAPAWVERHLRIPAEQYPRLRPLLGWLAMVHDVEISTPAGVATGETVAVYNEHKVVWVDDPGPEGMGLRPVIPFDRLLDQDDPEKQHAATRLVGAIRNSVSRYLYQGGIGAAAGMTLARFVHVRPTPTEESPYDIQGLYADLALELAYDGQVLEHVHDVGLEGIMLFHEFCEDLIVPAEPRA